MRFLRTVDADELPDGAALPDGVDPLADGVLMAHQRDWVADQSDLKLCEKGRRTGITFAEAQDDTIVAMTSRADGGDNVFYIGDTKEKGLEFVAYCAAFATAIAGELHSIGEYVFEDKQADGSTRDISAYRVRFESGHSVVALASTPASIRGLQGVVVIDEAAFHRNVKAVIAACNALLIWGGRIRIISTHNGDLNAFNELVKDTRKGKAPYSLHRITFDDAVANGLYERVCLMRGWTATEEGKREWQDRIRGSYGTNTAAEKEELDAVPQEGEGGWLSRVLIERRMNQASPVIRWAPPASFVDLPEHIRRAEAKDWCDDHLAPLLAELPADRLHYFGEDFGMRADRTSIAPLYIAKNLKRVFPFIVELKAVPFDQQRQVLFYVVHRLPKFNRGILDANGNGMPLAQLARQEFGALRIEELLATESWYRETMPLVLDAFENDGIELPADDDVLQDLRLVRMINGVARIPRDVRTDASDGGKRHGDSAIAIINGYAASLTDTVDLGDWQATAGGRAGAHGYQAASAPRHSDTGFGAVSASTDLRGF